MLITFVGRFSFFSCLFVFLFTGVKLTTARLQDQRDDHSAEVITDDLMGENEL